MAIEDPRLALPRKDVGKWGAIINQFLRVSHNEDGTLKIQIDFDLNTAHRLQVAGNPHVVTPTELSLVIGTDVLAEQTIGIADDNLLEVDGSPNSGEYARFTANGLEGRTEAEFKADFNLEVGAEGSVQFADAAGGLAQDNANFSYNNATNTLRIKRILAGGIKKFS